MTYRIDPARYKEIMRNGQRCKAVDPLVLAREITALLKDLGPTPKSIINKTLHASIDLTGSVLEALQASGEIESFPRISERKRSDVHWCMAGDPRRRRGGAGSAFRGDEILAAFRAEAGRRLAHQDQPEVMAA